jgi:hypothetical protein
MAVKYLREFLLREGPLILPGIPSPVVTPYKANRSMVAA